MSRQDRDGFDLGFYAALIALGIVLGAWLNVGDVQAYEPTPSQVTCFEDEPCWDCETMGNRICGADAPVPTLAPDAYDDGYQPPMVTLPDTAMQVHP